MEDKTFTCSRNAELTAIDVPTWLASVRTEAMQLLTHASDTTVEAWALALERELPGIIAGDLIWGSSDKAAAATAAAKQPNSVLAPTAQAMPLIEAISALTCSDGDLTHLLWPSAADGAVAALDEALRIVRHAPGNASRLQIVVALAAAFRGVESACTSVYDALRATIPSGSARAHCLLEFLCARQLLRENLTMSPRRAFEIAAARLAPEAGGTTTTAGTREGLHKRDDNATENERVHKPTTLSETAARLVEMDRDVLEQFVAAQLPKGAAGTAVDWSLFNQFVEQNAASTTAGDPLRLCRSDVPTSWDPAFTKLPVFAQPSRTYIAGVHGLGGGGRIGPIDGGATWSQVPETPVQEPGRGPAPENGGQPAWDSSDTQRSLTQAAERTRLQEQMHGYAQMKAGQYGAVASDGHDQGRLWASTGLVPQSGSKLSSLESHVATDQPQWYWNPGTAGRFPPRAPEGLFPPRANETVPAEQCLFGTTDGTRLSKGTTSSHPTVRGPGQMYPPVMTAQQHLERMRRLRKVEPAMTGQQPQQRMFPSNPMMTPWTSYAAAPVPQEYLHQYYSPPMPQQQPQVYYYGDPYGRVANPAAFAPCYPPAMVYPTQGTTPAHLTSAVLPQAVPRA